MSSPPPHPNAPFSCSHHIDAALGAVDEMGQLSEQSAARLLLRSLRHWCSEKGIDYFEASRDAEADFLRDVGL